MPQDANYNKSTVYHAVMQKSTGKFLPEIRGHARGYTHTEPQDFDKVMPRLHMHAGSARRAMHAWCEGIWKGSRGQDSDGEYYEEIVTTKVPGRDKADMEVRRIRLVIEEVETDLSDGRHYPLGGKTFAHEVESFEPPPERDPPDV